jgi:hypothetical protein
MAAWKPEVAESPLLHVVPTQNRGLFMFSYNLLGHKLALSALFDRHVQFVIPAMVGGA